MKNDLQLPLLKEASIRPSWFANASECFQIGDSGGWPDKFGSELFRTISGYADPPIRTLSLFSGGGGLDIGFHDAGFQIVECLELEKDFCRTLELNSSPGRMLSGTSIVCSDIKDYVPHIQAIDFMIGGPPCQTFSAAGARAAGVNGTDDERGNLFLQYARLTLPWRTSIPRAPVPTLPRAPRARLSAMPATLLLLLLPARRQRSNGAQPRAMPLPAMLWW
jgi:DNA (cytosine-5)-methyltransferase 1